MKAPPSESSRQQAIKVKTDEILSAAKPALKQALLPVIDEILQELSISQSELKAQNEELRRTKLALEQASTHYADLYNNAPAGYLTLNAEGLILELNQTAARLLGTPRNQIINRSFAEFIPDSIKELWLSHFESAKQSAGRSGCELPFGDKQAGLYYYHLDCIVDKVNCLVRIILTDVTHRKKNELQLREDVEVFSNLVELAPMGIGILDGQLRIKHLNAFARPVFSHLEAVVGRSFIEVMAELCDEETSHQLELLCKKALAEHPRSFHHNFSPVHPASGDKQNYHCQLLRTGFAGGDGIACYFDARPEDAVTSKNSSAGEELRRLQLFIKHAPAAIAMFDLDMRFLAASQRWLKNYALAEDIIGRSCHEVFPSIEKICKAYHGRWLMGESLSGKEHSFVRNDGKTQWLNWEIVPWHDAQGQIGGILLMTEEIADRKQLEEFRIAAAAFEAQESIIVTDIHRVILRVNKAFSRITGYSADETVGKTPVILHSGLHDAEFYNNILKTVEHEGYWQGEIWNKRKSGELFPVLETITAVRQENGKITHFVGMMIDISCQKQAEKALKEAQLLLEAKIATTQEELEKFKNEAIEVNTALNVLLRQRELDKNEAQSALFEEVENTVLPLLKKLETASGGRYQTLRLIKILENIIEQLVNSYGRAASLSAVYQKLTPIERQIALMIKLGKSTKVIAAALNISPGTVSIHRKHIRKKLNLNNKADNLQSFLDSLAE